MPRWTPDDLRAFQQRRARNNPAGREASRAKPEPAVRHEPVKAPRCDIGSKRPRHFNVCILCGSKFHAPHSSGRKYCSAACAYADPKRTEHIKPKNRGSATCENCHIVFRITRNHLTKRFCSQPCAASFTGRITIASIPRAPSKTHIEHTCESCGKTFKAWLANGRRFCSAACSTKEAKPHGRHKSGWIVIGETRIHVRSQWEANYAFYLEFQKRHRLIREWEFEPQTFWFEKIKRGVRSYLPDFRVTTTQNDCEYHEVKGWLDPKSKTKLKRMAKYHPAVRLVLIDSARFKAISQSAAFIPGWGTAPIRQQRVSRKEGERTELTIEPL